MLIEFETLLNDSFNKAINFVFKNTLCFFYNTFLICLLISFVSTLTQKVLYAYFVVATIFIVIAIINHQLMYFRSEYLKPVDIKLFSESRDISQSLEFIEPKSLTYIVAILFFSSIFLQFTVPLKIYSYTIYVFVFFAILLQFKFIREKVFRIKSYEYSDFDDYKNNGFLLSFIIRIGRLKKNKPKNYKKDISNVFLQHIPIKNVFKKPNIIIIMNESFFDINSVPQLDLSYNPLPNLQNISKNYTSGNIISPMIGGGTCQPEFEMLTGNSVLFTNKYKIAFIEYFKKQVKYFDSIAWTLRKLSYSCTFIHPYDKKFYNRDKAYTSLGFEKIIDIKSFENSFYPRNFVSDKDCYDKLIDEYENKIAKKPFFSVVVTMQNHPGYLDGKVYDEHGLEVLTDNVTKKEKTMLGNYANLLKESDDAIKYITDYFQDKENTIILFFGDHQPSNNIGFSRVAERSDLELSLTPYFIWDNYGLPKRDYGNISPFYLTPILLDIADIKSDKYFNYLYNKLNIIKALNTGFVIDKDDNYIKRENSPKEIEEFLEELHLIQHDRIFKNLS